MAKSSLHTDGLQTGLQPLTNPHQNRRISAQTVIDEWPGEVSVDQGNEMPFEDIIKADHVTDRSIGRRKEDRAIRGGGWAAGSERRRPVLQTNAAANSVLLAQVAALSPTAKMPDVAPLYAQFATPKSQAEMEREAFLREAELAHQAAQRAWVFERRTGQKPRSMDIEDADFVDI